MARKRQPKNMLVGLAVFAAIGGGIYAYRNRAAIKAKATQAVNAVTSSVGMPLRTVVAPLPVKEK